MPLYDFDPELYITMIRRAIGEEPMTHFASRANIATGNFCRICHGQRATPETLAKIAAASDFVSYNELLLAAGYMQSETNVPTVAQYAEASKIPQTGKIIKIPTVRNIPENIAQIKDDPTVVWDYYYEDAFGSGDFIFFIANDDALAPRINVGEAVLVDLSLQPEDGDVALLRFKGKPAILRKIKIKDNSFHIYGNDLSRYPMEKVRAMEVEIIGKGVRGFVGL